MQQNSPPEHTLKPNIWRSLSSGFSSNITSTTFGRVHLENMYIVGIDIEYLAVFYKHLQPTFPSKRSPSLMLTPATTFYLVTLANAACSFCSHTHTPISYKGKNRERKLGPKVAFTFQIIIILQNQSTNSTLSLYLCYSLPEYTSHLQPSSPNLIPMSRLFMSAAPLERYIS